MEEHTNKLITGGWADADGKSDFIFDEHDARKLVHEWWWWWLRDELKLPYMTTISEKIAESHEELEELRAIFPPKPLVFNAMRLCGAPRVVIIGQDPYQNEGLAMGLAFSVPPGIRIPPSLLNVYKELVRDAKIKDFDKMPTHGDLSSWAKQGVLLLNTALTVRESKSGSHSNFGWALLAEHAVKHVSDVCAGVVFMLWGNHAQSLGKHINAENHHTVLKCGHPSPLNRTNPFIGCGHFSVCNDALRSHGTQPVDWASVLKQ
jgi:uracil-DNA glycosylase